MKQIKVGIIGDFNPKNNSHHATNHALQHAATAVGVDIEINWLPTPELEQDTAEQLAPYQAVWCSPGSPYDSMDGALNAIRVARETGLPFIGT